MWKDGWRVVEGLTKFGPTPPVIGVIAIGGFIALSLKANAFAVVFIVFLLLGAYIWAQERQAKWRRDELKAEYDEINQRNAPEISRRLTRRKDINALRDQPTLFPDEESKK